MPTVAQRVVPLTKPSIGPEEEQAVLDVLRSGWLVQGARVADFERRIAEYCGAKHAIATTNCTTALQLALEQLSLQPGDEVVVPSFTFVASINAIIHAGGTPRIVDVDADTLNIDVSAAERAINARTRAIMPVDQFGLAADLHAINALAAAHGLSVIEDAAPALGAEIDGRRVGGICEVTCFSFHPRKTITSAEGGMIVTDRDDVAERARLMRSHAASISDLARHEAEDDVVIESYPEAGFNFRMSDLHAAVGLAQLERIDSLITRRRQLASSYDAAFADLRAVKVPVARPGFLHTYQSYQIVLDETDMTRNGAMRELKRRGVITRRGCMAVHKEPYIVKRYGYTPLPVAERLESRGICIPLYPSMDPADQAHVVVAIQDVLG